MQLARLLLSKRKIWILDEPTSHADLLFRTILEKELLAHVNNGGLCLMITHDEDLLSNIQINANAKKGISIVFTQKGQEVN